MYYVQQVTSRSHTHTVRQLVGQSGCQYYLLSPVALNPRPRQVLDSHEEEDEEEAAEAVLGGGGEDCINSLGSAIIILDTSAT
jgi:hypothetical protein